MASRSRVRIDPRCCDRCGRCLSVCSRNAIRVGRTFIAIDPVACDGCGACVAACGQGALTAAEATGSMSRRARVPVRAAPRTRERPVAGSAATPRARSQKAASAASGGGWTLLEALTMLSVTLAAFVAKEAALALAPVRALPLAAIVLVRAAVLAGYYGAQVVALRWLLSRRGLALRDLVAGDGGPARSFAWTLWAGAAVLVGARVSAIAYGLLMRGLGIVPDSSALLETFGAEPAGLVIAAVLVVLVGPLVEEAVFRGVVLQGLESKLGAPAAIAVQAVIFAALHRSAWLFVPMMVLGAALGWLAHATRRLALPVAVHASYNAITVLAAFALRG